jgi:23S rRNA (pseudouridine1915-N3)-methyltransferase
MKILVISVSKNKTDFDDLRNEYMLRISKYFKVEEDILAPGDKKQESEKIISRIKTGDYVILLDENGSQIKSEEFAEFLENRMNDSVQRLVVIIGGAYGVSDEIKNRANYTLSLSKMVFPHNLAKLVLFEQLYRAVSILNNSSYHHE